MSNKKDLQPIGGTAIYPLGVYSTKVKDIKDLKQGDTVTIPNDETNQPALSACSRPPVS